MVKRKREDFGIVRLKPRFIGFTQDTISKWINMMRNGRKVKVSLDFVVDSVLDGEVDIDSIEKIEVFQKTNLASGLTKWFSLDNRRLWIYKTLDELGYGDGDFSIDCKHVPFENVFARKFTTTNDGETVQVRGTVKDRVKLIAKRRCGSTMNPGEACSDHYFEDEIINPVHEESNDTVPARKKLRQFTSFSEDVINESDEFYINPGLQINMETKCFRERRKCHRNRPQKLKRKCTNFAVTDNSSNFVLPQSMPRFEPFNFCSIRQPMPPNICRQPFSDVTNRQHSFNTFQQPPLHFDHIYSNSSNRLMSGENVHQNALQRDQNLQTGWNCVSFHDNIRCQPPLLREGQLPRFNQQIPSNFRFSSVHHPMKNISVMQIPAASSYYSRTDFHEDSHYDELFHW